MTDLDLCRQLVLCIATHLQHIERDGHANSKGHVDKIEQDNRALFAILHGQEPELIPHI